MDASSKANRAFKQGAASRSQFVWIAVLLAAFIVALSFARAHAGVKPAANQDETRVRLTINTLPHFDCGYEPRGAEEAIARHQMHARRSPDRLAARFARPLAAPNQDQGDLALIEDDGSIIVPPSAFDLTK